MAKGTVKWFSPDKGYGFICPDDGSGDLFVHFSAITAGNTPEGQRNLDQGATVIFEVGSGQKGPVAVDVRQIS